MTYDDPGSKNKNKRHEQFAEHELVNGLALLNHIGQNISLDIEQAKPARLAYAGPAEKEAPDPKFEVRHDSMKMDKDKLDKEIMPKVKEKMPKYAMNKPIENMSDVEKADALVLVLRVSNPFELERDSDKKHKPRTVEEVFTEKKWDCDEIARVYIVLAEQLGLTGFSQFEVRVRDISNGEIHSHSALLYNVEKGGIMYLDPATGESKYFEKYNNEEELIRSQEFSDYFLGVWSKSIAVGKTGEIVELGIVKGKDSADAIYHSEMGQYRFNNAQTRRNFEASLAFLEAAKDEGVASAQLYFNLGQCHYALVDYFEEKDEKNIEKEYNTAAAYFKKAKDKITDEREKTIFCGFLGSAYLNLGMTDKAAEEWGEQLSLASKYNMAEELVVAKMGLAKVHINFGSVASSYEKALDELKIAEQNLLEAYAIASKNELDLTDVRKNFKALYERRYAVYQNIGDENKIRENREKTLESGTALGIPREELEKILK